MKNQIQEILDIIKPMWLKPYMFETEEIQQLKTLGFEDIEEYFYDGKIIHFKYKGIICSFIKYDDYRFNFQQNGLQIKIVEDCKNEYTVQQFFNKTDKQVDPFSIQTPFQTNCKIYVLELPT